MSGPTTDPRAGWNEIAADYDRTRALPGDGETVTPLRLGRLFSELAAARVLEVGVGTGRMAVPLAATGLSVVGADLSWPMLGELQAKSPAATLHAVRADAFALPFRERSFDALLCAHFLHLLPDIAEFVKHVKPLLSPGAHVVSVDSAFSPVPVLERVLAAVFPHLGLEFSPWPTGENSRDRECFREFLTARGGEELHDVPVGLYPNQTSHAERLADIRARYAWTFRRYDQATIDRAVDAAEAELRAAGIDLGAAVDEPRGVRLLVGRLP